MNIKKFALVGGLIGSLNLVFALPLPLGNVQNNQNGGYKFSTQSKMPTTPFYAGAPTAGGEYDEAKDILMSLETDLLIFNEAAALLKLNQLMLERLPISDEDDWPELLTKYRDESGINKSVLDAYNQMLDKELKREFYFYNFLLENAARGLLNMFSGGLRTISGAVRTLQTGVIIGMGRKLEHAKWIIYYKPPVCENDYFAKLFNLPSDLATKEKQFCNIKKNYPGCDIFEKSWEQVLTEYWYKSKNHSIKDWLNLKVSMECLRPVKGKIYTTSKGTVGTFEDLFFTLLPDKYKSQIKEVEEELAQKLKEKGNLEAELKREKDENKKAAIKKQLDELDKEIERLKGARAKLYRQAQRELQLTKERYELAKKLYHVADYVADTDNKIFALVTVTVAKFVLDSARAISYAPQLAAVAVATAVTPAPSGGQLTPQMVKQRLKYLVTNVITSPATIISIYGSLMAQKNLIEQRRDYLKALIEVGKKIYEPKSVKK